MIMVATGFSVLFVCTPSLSPLSRTRPARQAVYVGNGAEYNSAATRPIISSLSSSTSSTISEAPIISDGHLQSFKAWLSQKGLVGGGSSCVRPEHCGSQGLGLVAHEHPIAQGEEVLSVPQELWMSVAAARAHPEIGPFCANLRPWVALAVFLLFEKSRPSSPWRAYIDILPRALDSPLFWSNEELTELEGTQLLGSILGYQQHVESEYSALLAEVISPNPQLFNRAFFTRETFLWAFGILRSRTFPPLTGDDLALVPLADLVKILTSLPWYWCTFRFFFLACCCWYCYKHLAVALSFTFQINWVLFFCFQVNHGMVTNVDGPSWEKKSSGFFPRRDYLTLRAPVAAKKGDQVFMQYGKKKSNGQLALDYGFVECNPRNTAVRDSFMLTLELSESDRFFGDKIDIAELNDLGATVYFDLVHEQGIPDNLLPFLRLIALGGPDAFLLEALFRNSVWGHLQSPVSRENEEAACKAILDGCRSALAGYPTTMDEDLNLLKGGQISSKLEMAVVIRLGEKRVLEELQLSFENQMANLDQLEYYAERRLRGLGLMDDKGDITPWIFEV